MATLDPKVDAQLTVEQPVATNPLGGVAAAAGIFANTFAAQTRAAGAGSGAVERRRQLEIGANARLVKDFQRAKAIGQKQGEAAQIQAEREAFRRAHLSGFVDINSPAVGQLYEFELGKSKDFAALDPEQQTTLAIQNDENYKLVVAAGRNKLKNAVNEDGSPISSEQLAEWHLNQTSRLASDVLTVKAAQSGANAFWVAGGSSAYNSVFQTTLDGYLGELADKEFMTNDDVVKAATLFGQATTTGILRRPDNISNEQWDAQKAQVDNAKAIFDRLDKATSKDAVETRLMLNIIEPLMASADTPFKGSAAALLAFSNSQLLADSALGGAGKFQELVQGLKEMRLDTNFNPLNDDPGSTVLPSASQEDVLAQQNEEYKDLNKGEIYNKVKEGSIAASAFDLSDPEHVAAFPTAVNQMAAGLRNGKQFITHKGLSEVMGPAFWKNFDKYAASNPDEAGILARQLSRDLAVERERQNQWLKGKEAATFVVYDPVRNILTVNEASLAAQFGSEKRAKRTLDAIDQHYGGDAEAAIRDQGFKASPQGGLSDRDLIQQLGILTKEDRPIMKDRINAISFLDQQAKRLAPLSAQGAVGAVDTEAEAFAALSVEQRDAFFEEMFANAPTLEKEDLFDSEGRLIPENLQSAADKKFIAENGVTPPVPVPPTKPQIEPATIPIPREKPGPIIREGSPLEAVLNYVTSTFDTEIEKVTPQTVKLKPQKQTFLQELQAGSEQRYTQQAKNRAKQIDGLKKAVTSAAALTGQFFADTIDPELSAERFEQAKAGQASLFKLMTDSVDSAIKEFAEIEAAEAPENRISAATSRTQEQEFLIMKKRTKARRARIAAQLMEAASAAQEYVNSTISTINERGEANRDQLSQDADNVNKAVVEGSRAVQKAIDDAVNLMVVYADELLDDTLFGNKKKVLK